MANQRTSSKCKDLFNFRLIFITSWVIDVGLIPDVMVWSKPASVGLLTSPIYFLDNINLVYC